MTLLENKNIIVTGTSRGMGKEMVRERNIMIKEN